MRHRVYLVPGFFGFAYIGEFKYFAHVRDVLGADLAAKGIDAEIIYVRTRPTASIRRRAQRLFETVAETSREGDAVHLVGHSSGGLDARLLASPGVDLGPDIDVESVASRLKSVVTVAAPHRGTPLAQFFTEVTGRRLMVLFSIISLHVVRRGPLPLRMAIRLAELVRTLDRKEKHERNMIDQLFEQVLSEFSPDRQQALAEFFEDVSGDQGLMLQLVPSGAELLDATMASRPGVREGSVVLRAKPPALGGMIAAGFDAYAQAMHTAYWWLHGRVGSGDPNVSHEIAPEHLTALRPGIGEPLPTSNDGIVPVWSQTWGTIVHATWADHLDAIGHFHDPAHEPPHYDWITSGTGFDRRRFQRLWRDVAGFLAGERD